MKDHYNKLQLILLFLTAFVVTASAFCLYSPSITGDFSHKSVQTVETAHDNELLLLFLPDVSAKRKREILHTLPAQTTIVQEYDNFMLVSINERLKTNDCYERLKCFDEISAVDYNASLSLCETEDTYTSTQWAFNNPGYYDKLIGNNLIQLPSTMNIDLDLEEAFSIYNQDESSKEIVVAVIDTGVDNNHPDLMNSMWINKGEIPDDGIDNDMNGYVDDIFGWDFYNKDNTVCHYEMDDETEEISAASDDLDNHGTHIAGIIAATANNNKGIAGVASNINVKIMSLKIHGGPNGKGTISDAIIAIKYATMMGAKVCNLSWGSTTYNIALEQVISESPMLFITAAGNGGQNNDKTPMYPANYQLPNVISVTFINPYGALSQKSNYGVNSVDFAAPGTDILSTIVGSYATMSGSSMAAPYITGLAAMVYSYSSLLNPAQVKEVIANSVKPLNSLENSIKYPGLPSALFIVSTLSSLEVDEEAPTLSISTSYDKESIELSFIYNDNGGSNIRILSYLPGKKEISAFKKGTSGIVIDNNSLTLTKAGLYTFYISDYAGNEACYYYEVIDDTKAPTITSNFHYSIDNKMLTIELNIRDKQSGIKTVKYLPGKKSLDDFKAAFTGILLTLENSKTTLRFSESGEYTIYAIDYRGNKTIHTVDAGSKPINSLSVNSVLMNMSQNQKERLKVSYDPIDTTERIYYISSNPEIVSISQWGMLHAKVPGKAVITIRTSGGITRKIVITVK